mgnify:CR=1 FL=1|jgi:hypothetical protein
MVVLVILGYAVVAAFELWLWSERPWRQIVAYLGALLAAAALSVLIVSGWEVPVPQPLGMFLHWVSKLWSGGGQQ